MSTDFDLYTIGHSNLAAERFLACWRTPAHGRRRCAFEPYRRFPFSGAGSTAAEPGYRLSLPGEVLGTAARPSLYCDGVADYEAIAAVPEFKDGLDRLTEAAHDGRVCVMCAERDPLNCHRCLLVGRLLAARKVKLGHILGDGTIEPHVATEERLLALASKDGGDLFHDRSARLADAYRRRARAVAATAKN
jgi:hypothetical protein